MTLDSNIVIAYLGGDESVIETLLHWKEEGRILFLPAVVETEVLSFSNFTPSEKHYTEEFLESLNFVAMDRNIARVAADLRRSTKIKFPDATVAATALATHTPIVTRNLRDFKKIPGLTVIEI